MTAAARPQATVSPVEPKTTALALYNKKELATFTSPEGKALITAKLSAGVKYEQVLAELWFAIQKNPDIAACTPDSQLLAVDRALSWGLAIGDKVHLVPFSTKNGKLLTAVRDYKGDIELIYRATGVHVDANVVWNDEKFDYELGDSPWVKHKPALKRQDGAQIIAAYAVAHMGRGQPPKIVVLGVDAINAIRKDKSKSWWEEWHPTIKGKKQVIPIERIPWYAEKTVVHKIAKQLPTTATTATKMAEISTQLEEEIVTDAEIEEAPPAGVTNASHGGTPDADGAVAEKGDGPRNGPPCPKCGAAMRDDTVTKTNVKAPDYQCVAVVGQNAAEAVFCDGKYWPGQWPPKPLATDDQRAELGRLAKVAERVGLKKVTIDAVNKKVADPELKTHHADQHIKALKEKIEAKEKENDAAARLKGGNGNLDSHPDTKGKF